MEIQHIIVCFMFVCMLFAGYRFISIFTGIGKKNKELEEELRNKEKLYWDGVVPDFGDVKGLLHETPTVRFKNNFLDKVNQEEKLWSYDIQYDTNCIDYENKYKLYSETDRELALKKARKGSGIIFIIANLFSLPLLAFISVIPILAVLWEVLILIVVSKKYRKDAAEIKNKKMCDTTKSEIVNGKVLLDSNKIVFDIPQCVVDDEDCRVQYAIPINNIKNFKWLETLTIELISGTQGNFMYVQEKNRYGSVVTSYCKECVEVVKLPIQNRMGRTPSGDKINLYEEEPDVDIYDFAKNFPYFLGSTSARHK